MLGTANTQLRNSRSQLAPRACKWFRSSWLRQPEFKVLIPLNSRLTVLGTCAGIRTYGARNGSSRTSSPDSSRLKVRSFLPLDSVPELFPEKIQEQPDATGHVVTAGIHGINFEPDGLIGR